MSSRLKHFYTWKQMSVWILDFIQQQWDNSLTLFDSQFVFRDMIAILANIQSNEL